MKTCAVLGKAGQSDGFICRPLVTCLHLRFPVLGGVSLCRPSRVWDEDSHLPDEQGECVCGCVTFTDSAWGLIHVERPTWSQEADDISLTCASRTRCIFPSSFLTVSVKACLN